jgi:hypothetical protein
MDPVIVETAAAAALVVAQRALEGVGDGVAQASVNSAGALVQRVRSRFRGDRPAEAALVAVELSPQEPALVAQLGEALLRHLQADPAFAEAIRAMVDDAATRRSGPRSRAGDKSPIFNDQVHIGRDFNIS